MTRWQAAPRGAAAEAIVAAAEADRTKRPDRYDLGSDAVERVIARATRADDLVTRDQAEWRDGLEQYLGSAAEDGRLNALGERMLLDGAVGKLRARRSIALHLQTHPGVEVRPLLPPIVVIGGWRTGTTFLFRLLATDPRLRAPLPAELTTPWRLATCDHDAREQLLDTSGAAHDLLHILNPTMAAVHDSGPRLPEECVLAMGTDFRNWALASSVRLNGYARWLASQDLAASYRAYRRVLQMLDAGDQRRWLLKAPAHTAELPHLAAAFPGACIVHLHRDIVETIASATSLFATFRSTYSDAVDGSDVGRFQADQTELWLRRAAAFQTTADSASVTVIDVRYEDLISATPSTLRRIYTAAGIDAPPDLHTMINRYHAIHPRGREGSHRYEPEDFGLDGTELHERFAFYEPYLAPR